MRFIAAARHLAVLKQSDAAATAYTIWDDQRAALGVFVDLLSGGREGRAGDLRR
jgi:hypothetical protein